MRTDMEKAREELKRLDAEAERRRHKRENVPTPRPWRWAWSCTNELTIYHTDGKAHNTTEVATIVCDDKAYRAQTEADAELICRLVNEHSEGGPHATD